MEAEPEKEPRAIREDIFIEADDVTHSVRGFDFDNLSTSQVVGLATGAAALLGTIVAALGPAQTDQPRRDFKAVGDGGKGKPIVAVVEGRKISDRTRKQLRRQIDTLQEEINRLEPAVEKQRKERGIIAADELLVPVSEKEQPPMSDEAVLAVLKNGKLTRKSRKQLRKEVDGIRKDIDRVDKAIAKKIRSNQRQANINEARAAVGEAVGNVGDNLGKKIAAVGSATAAAAAPIIERALNAESQIRDNARQVADNTRDSARNFADTARDQGGDLSDRVRNDVVPAVAERATKVQGFMQDVLPQVAQLVRDDLLPQVVQKVREELLPQVTDTASKAGEAVSAFAATGANVGRDTAKTIAKGDLAKEVSKQTYRGRKQAASALSNLAAQLEPPKQRSNASNFFMFALIAAIAGGIIYIFQNEERRKKVAETTQALVEQGREIVRDFQGYDEEF